MPPSLSASSEGSTGMLPYSHQNRDLAGSALCFLPAVERRRTQSDFQAGGTGVIAYSYPLPRGLLYHFSEFRKLGMCSCRSTQQRRGPPGIRPQLKRDPASQIATIG